MFKIKLGEVFKYKNGRFIVVYGRNNLEGQLSYEVYAIDNNFMYEFKEEDLLHSDFERVKIIEKMVI